MTGEAQGSGRCVSGIAQASCTHPLEDSLRQGTTSLATRCAGKRHTHRAQALRAHPMEDASRQGGTAVGTCSCAQRAQRSARLFGPELSPGLQGRSAAQSSVMSPPSAA